MFETLGVAAVSEIPDNEKENDVTPDTKSDEAKKKSEMKELFTRMFSGKTPADEQEDGESAK